MDALTLSMILIFGAAALVPVVWAVICLIKGNSRFWFPVVGAIFAVVTLLVLFIGMATDWYGCCNDNATVISCVNATTHAQSTVCPHPNPWPQRCGDAGCTLDGVCTQAPAGSYCPVGEAPVFTFCEEFSDGVVKQPWSTWSDLSFIASGLWILWWLARFGRGDASANPMRSLSVLAMTYGLIVVFMGPGSMYYHASVKNWGAYFDSLSVVLWLGFNAAYVWHMLLFSMWGKLQGAWRTGIVLGATALFLLIFGIVGWVNPDARLSGYLVCGTLWGVGEIAYLFFGRFCSGVKYERNGWIFLLNFLILAVTMTIWVFFNPDIGPITPPEACRERESFPGHALFHILASFATMATFWSFVTERRRVVAD
ncbi:MAG: hypothetical protein AAFU65_05890 [Pseudomonadota bacterium]